MDKYFAGTSVQFIDASGNLIYSLPHENVSIALSNHPTLLRFILSKNKLQGNLRIRIGNRQLTLVDISNNSLSGDISPAFNDAPALEYHYNFILLYISMFNFRFPIYVLFFSLFGLFYLIE